MPPRSPTQAFDPTPALEHNHHFSQFNGIYRSTSTDSYDDAPAKEVRFEEPVANTSIHGRHSIATSNVPLLPAIASASHIPKQSFRITNPSANVDISAYFEHCREVNEQLRHAHEQERKAWEIERMSLKTRIADLEFKLNKANGGRRRLSNDSPFGSGISFRSDFMVPPVTGANGTRHNTVANIHNHHLDLLKQEGIKPVWQPESPVPATRVFSQDDDVQHLASISEDKPLDNLSPQRSHENKPIPIQEIDETLDGITVKSEGVKSSFNKVMSPIIIASPARSPSPKQSVPEPPRLQLDASNLLDPLDAKLKRHAGHTPLAFDGPVSEVVSTTDATPQPEGPIAPAPTTRPPLRPSERSQSYFSTDDIHAPAPIPAEEEPEPVYETVEDKPLTGPLMLDASGKSDASHTFLEQLDSKLEEEVRRSQSNSPIPSPAPSQQSTRTDDGYPRLKLKKSTNFGSAYGLSVPGTCDR